MSPRVREVLSWYGADNIGVLTNLARILNQGRLKGTGKLVLLSVDHGVEHGPARSFSKIPDSYDPSYHMELAIESGCNAYVAPLGALEFCARDYAGEIPLILKLNNSDSFLSKNSATSIFMASIESALSLGCVGVNITIHPENLGVMQVSKKIAMQIQQARQAGLVVVVSSRPKNSESSNDEDVAIDKVSYSAHLAAQFGAHIVNLKLPGTQIDDEFIKNVYQKNGIKVNALVDQARHLAHSTFSGKRILTFAGGEFQGSESLLQNIRELARGGVFGCMIGRNAFQRPRSEALTFLQEVMDAFIGK